MISTDVMALVASRQLLHRARGPDYFYAKQDVVLQMSGTGPSGRKYVNP
jgi:hypothetical protein